MPRNRILVIDDEPAVRFGMRDFLEQNGFHVEEAADCRGARAALRDAAPDVAILDFALPDGNALELLTEFRESEPSLPVVILTGHGTIDLAVRAIKQGADHFLTKPVELPTLLVILQRLLEGKRNRRQRLANQSRQAREVFEPFVGTSAAITRLAGEARKVAEVDSPLLILGETGAGKGVLARWLHARSPRAEETFVDLNCAGLSPELLDSELFGHEKGAFTSADAAKTGLLEIGHRGTVFLDEIGDMQAQVQPKLLKVLEEKRFRRIGGVQDRYVSIRLIAATHQDLSQLVAEKKFRSDLYFRINTHVLTIPPLRQRIEDIPPLAGRILRQVAADLGRGEVLLSPEAVDALCRHSWPGNIRELRNVVERGVLHASEGLITSRDLRFDPLFPAGGQAADSPPGTGLTLQELERLHIERVFHEEGGRTDKVAARLGISRSSLYERLKRYEIAYSRN
jgi:DNA-binding NtrC family response regulator